MDYEKLRQRIRTLELAGQGEKLLQADFPEWVGKEWLEFAGEGRIPCDERFHVPADGPEKLAEFARKIAEFTKREFPFEVGFDAGGRPWVRNHEGFALDQQVDLFVAAFLLRREEGRLP